MVSHLVVNKFPKYPNNDNSSNFANYMHGQLTFLHFHVIPYNVFGIYKCLLMENSVIGFYRFCFQFLWFGVHFVYLLVRHVKENMFFYDTFHRIYELHVTGERRSETSCNEIVGFWQKFHE